MSTMLYIRKTVFSMTQVEFAAALKVAQSQVSRWEKGTREPSHRELQAMRQLALDRGLEWSDSWIFEVPDPQSTEGTPAC